MTQQLADALSAAAASLLAPAAAAELGYDGNNDEFGRQLCDAMAAVAPHFGAVGCRPLASCCSAAFGGIMACMHVGEATEGG